MNITLTQGILLSIMAFIVGVDFWLEAFFIFRPIIVSTLTGAILGDLKLGIIAGGLTELIFAGLTPAGGTQPPNPVLAGVMTVVLAHTTGSSPEKAIGLALPFSFLMQYIILFYYSSFTVFASSTDKYAEELNDKGIINNAVVATLIVGISYSIIVFLSAYAAQDAMKSLVTSMPEWLSHAFQVAGGILPAIGFGLLLKTMLKAKYVPYLILGFILSNFIQYSNLLPIAGIGVVIGLISYFNDVELENKLKTVPSSSEQGDEDGI
ncbi:PTS system, mannose/fructose/sorbose family, IIC component [Helcococcus kunzii ATCC 51366]|uniref:PTS system, mannose/fructose/sorbose family, IIC component n=1 Tax=Helcococcus kunzii ATCC 51366 TaxID=883114 RepID=H3NQ57_9FIRM|nr:PTS galactosamine transporter subunit IIC [Helcococcus kunzii]EHR32537.1 PTS system, mannose/fructose/sorbose family, IIC component [Helcococcus kunzii ATCC 51366]MCT1796368.1 PTS galactosamine transporter subunit IIC [Helcococcus kunzii]MCT1989418.1 PTS galactosamine transporter subunit IIC [Helcococcus kunzii]